MVKKIIKKFLPEFVKDQYIHIAKQIRNFKILALEYGQFRTIKNWVCVDRDGNPIPWYTYPAIEFLSHLDLRGFSVFEYGSGFSTLWWSQRVRKIVSIEHDKDWFAKIKSKIQDKKRIQYKLADPDIYPFEIMNYSEPFDIIIIDGIKRPLCAKCVVEYIKKYGGKMIIFDNSDWHPNTIDFLRENLDWIEVDFHGFGPINNYTWTTSVFLSPNFRTNYSLRLQSLGCLKRVSLEETDNVKKHS